MCLREDGFPAASNESDSPVRSAVKFETRSRINRRANDAAPTTGQTSYRKNRYFSHQQRDNQHNDQKKHRGHGTGVSKIAKRIANKMPRTVILSRHLLQSRVVQAGEMPFPKARYCKMSRPGNSPAAAEALQAGQHAQAAEQACISAGLRNCDHLQGDVLALSRCKSGSSAHSLACTVTDEELI